MKVSAYLIPERMVKNFALASTNAKNFTVKKTVDFEEIDKLAELMLEPDKNFNKLIKIWDTKKKFRILNSTLVGDDSHVKWK